jgi:hypothetical protein
MGHPNATNRQKVHVCIGQTATFVLIKPDHVDDPKELKVRFRF